MVSVSLAGGEPLSVTRMTMELVLGPWDSVGVQVNPPVAALIDAPAGAPGSIEKLRICAGISGSLAVTVNERSEPSTTTLFPIGFRTGAALLSVTTIVITSKLLSGGDPPSVTRTVTGLVLGP